MTESSGVLEPTPGLSSSRRLANLLRPNRSGGSSPRIPPPLTGLSGSLDDARLPSPAWSGRSPTEAGPPPSRGAGRLTPFRAAAAAVFHSPRSSQPSEGPLVPPPALKRAKDRVVGPTHTLRLVPYMDMTRSIPFIPTAVDVQEGGHALQIGRFSDRRGWGAPSEERSPTTLMSVVTDDVASGASTRITFQSKVVSRLHAEVWCETGGPMFIRDTKSSSGTFLNSARLAPSGTPSKPFPLKDGDVIQLGIDYQGGAEELYRSIKLRVEIDPEDRVLSTAYGSSMLKQLQSMHTDDTLEVAPTPAPGGARPECCICLYSIRVQQAVFMAPCSHMFHYKCIRPLLALHHPGFACPLCRHFVNLEADVEVEVEAEGVLASPLLAPRSTGSVPSTPDPRGIVGFESPSVMYSALTSPMHTSPRLAPMATALSLDNHPGLYR